jgi:2-polyprenyl-6-methoxyphenol hydroxylase-like FAD-dependent oxidoreductase
MALPLDVCVRGGGVVGRALALLLARERLRVGLVESPAAGADDVRAYAMNAASRELLSLLRAWPEARVTPVLGMAVYGDAGGQVTFGLGDAATATPPQAPGPLAWIAYAGDLLHALDQALHYQPQVERLSEPREAALTVVCEGRDSQTRQALGVQWQAQPYAQHAIAARVRCERAHGQVARQWFLPGEILALLPLGGEPAVGGDASGAAANVASSLGQAASEPTHLHDAALVWSVPAEQAAALCALDAAQFEQRLTQAAGQGALGHLTLTTERARWPLQRAEATRWCGPGWALAGDAAHTVHPLAGQGLNLGLADVRTLSDVLRTREYWRALGDERLLRRYERARRGEVAAMQWTTGGLQWLFAPPQPAWRWARNWGMRGFERSGPLKQWVVRQAAGGL